MVYLDILFLWNWAMDGLILMLVKKDFFPNIKKRKIAAGAFFSSGTYLFWFVQKGIVSEMFRIAEAVLLLSLILIWTFSIRSVSLFCKVCISALGYAFLMGGACLALQSVCIKKEESTAFWWIGAGCLIVCIGSWFAGQKIKKSKTWIKTSIYEVEIQRNGQTAFFEGLYDSGNLLISQWTGQGICVLSLEAAAKLLEEREQKMMSILVRQEKFPWKAVTENLWSGIHKIVYSSVGTKEDWMPGIFADRIVVKKGGTILADRAGIIGIAKENIFREGRMVVLLPADIFAAEQLYENDAD